MIRKDEMYRLRAYTGIVKVAAAWRGIATRKEVREIEQLMLEQATKQNLSLSRTLCLFLSPSTPLPIWTSDNGGEEPDCTVRLTAVPAGCTVGSLTRLLPYMDTDNPRFYSLI